MPDDHVEEEEDDGALLPNEELDEGQDGDRFTIMRQNYNAGSYGKPGRAGGDPAVRGGGGQQRPAGGDTAAAPPGGGQGAPDSDALVQQGRRQPHQVSTAHWASRP